MKKLNNLTFREKLNKKKESVYNIFSYLDGDDYLSFLSVSKDFRELIRDFLYHHEVSCYIFKNMKIMPTKRILSNLQKNIRFKDLEFNNTKEDYDLITRAINEKTQITKLKLFLEERQNSTPFIKPEIKEFQTELLKLIQINPQMTDLTFEYSRNEFSHTFLEFSFRYLKNLKTINLDVNIPLEQVFSLTKDLQHLTKLSCKHVYSVCWDVKDKSNAPKNKITSTQFKLNEFEADFNDKKMVYSFDYLNFLSPDTLMVLDLECCFDPYDFEIFGKFKNLTSLQFSGPIAENKEKDFLVNFNKMLKTTWKGLKKVGMNLVVDYDQQTFTEFFSIALQGKIEELNVLNIKTCKDPMPLLLNKIDDNFTVTKFCINFLPFLQISEKLKVLKTISLVAVMNDKQGQSFDMHNFSFISRAPVLEKITFNRNSVNSEFASSLPTIAFILEECKNLKELRLQNNQFHINKTFLYFYSNKLIQPHFKVYYNLNSILVCFLDKFMEFDFKTVPSAFENFFGQKKKSYTYEEFKEVFSTVMKKRLADFLDTFGVNVSTTK